MRKRSLLLIFLILLITVLLSAVVLANGNNVFTTVTGLFNQFIGFFATFIGDITETIIASPGIWVKFMFWMAILAILYQGASAIPMFNNKTAKIVAVVISIISVVFIPDEILIAAASLYSGAIFTLIIAIPFGVLVYTSYRIRQAGNRWTYFLIAALWLIFIIILSSISSLVVDVSVLPKEGDLDFIGPPRPPTTGVATTALHVVIEQEVVETVVSIMLLLAFIFMIYFIVKGFTSEGAGAEGEEGVEQRRQAWSRAFSGFRGGASNIATSAGTFITKINNLSDNFAGNRTRILTELTKLGGFADRFKTAANRMPREQRGRLLDLSMALRTHVRNTKRAVNDNNENRFHQCLDQVEEVINGIIAEAHGADGSIIK